MVLINSMVEKVCEIFSAMGSSPRSVERKDKELGLYLGRPRFLLSWVSISSRHASHILSCCSCGKSFRALAMALLYISSSFLIKAKICSRCL